MINLFLFTLLFSCCQKNVSHLQGAGATFPEPLYQKMFQEYAAEKGVNVNYAAIGSGGGIYRLQEKAIDFAASDLICEDIIWKDQVIYVPTCLGAVAMAYNLPANPTLDLTPEILSEIFLGEIKNWNDERIKKLNPDLILPNQRIMTINRSDKSGTSQVFTNYLNKVCPKWQEQQNKPLKQLFGLTVASNKEMSKIIMETPGTIGPICLSYALSGRLSFARVRNVSGNFILPTWESVSLAAGQDDVTDNPTDLTNTSAEYGYPISSFTWLLVYRDLSYLEKQKTEQLLNLIEWIITDGQVHCAPLNYAPLPQAVVAKSQKILQTIIK